MAKEIAGLFEYGYTDQTFRIADAIVSNPTVRMKMADFCHRAGEDEVYSGQRFDRKQQIADFLAEVIRQSR